MGIVNQLKLPWEILFAKDQVNPIIATKNKKEITVYSLPNYMAASSFYLITFENWMPLA